MPPEVERPGPPSPVELEDSVWTALHTVKDPCHVLTGYDLSIVDLGLVNSVQFDRNSVEISVTFTEPACVFSYKIISEIEDLADALDGVSEIRVISDPYPMWTPARMNSKAQQMFLDRRNRFAS